jgi:hypothetical protein
LTGLCPRPVTSNRTRPVTLGAYWTLTGRLCSASGQANSTSGRHVKSGSDPVLTVHHILFFPLSSARRCLLPNPSPSWCSPALLRAGYAPHPLAVPPPNLLRRRTTVAAPPPTILRAAAPPPLLFHPQPRRRRRSSIARAPLSSTARAPLPTPHRFL